MSSSSDDEPIPAIYNKPLKQKKHKEDDDESSNSEPIPAAYSKALKPPKIEKLDTKPDIKRKRSIERGAPIQRQGWHEGTSKKSAHVARVDEKEGRAPFPIRTHSGGELLAPSPQVPLSSCSSFKRSDVSEESLLKLKHFEFVDSPEWMCRGVGKCPCTSINAESAKCAGVASNASSDSMRVTLNVRVEGENFPPPVISFDDPVLPLCFASVMRGLKFQRVTPIQAQVCHFSRACVGCLSYSLHACSRLNSYRDLTVLPACLLKT